MAKINIPFNNTNYSIDEASLSAASAALRTHLSTAMNGTGAMINFDGVSYNIDSTKLSNATSAFIAHLGTVAGNGKKVFVNGVEYNIDSAKMAGAISDLHAVLGGLQSGNEGSGGETIDRTIPDGAYYGNLNALTFYSEMPETVSDGDIYVYGDYIYTYFSNEDIWSDGWRVSLATEDSGIKNYIPNYICTDKNQTSYGEILTSINGKYIKSMKQTFTDCYSLVVAPAIPVSVIDMSCAFQVCPALVSPPDMSNLTSVTNMYAIFNLCTGLTTAPFIPESVTNLEKAFIYCDALTGTVEIPCSCEGQDIGYSNISIKHIAGCEH